MAVWLALWPLCHWPHPVSHKPQESRVIMTQENPKAPSKLVRLGIIIATLIMGLYVLSSIFKNFSHLITPPAATAPVENAAPAP